MSRLFDSGSDFVVGIGSSAGGLDALRKFFGSLPPSPNIAYVVLQHISDKFESFTKDLLTNYTEMPIIIVDKNEIPLQPGHIYIKITKRALGFKDTSKICLTQPESTDDYNFPIDTDLHTIAETFKNQSIGIILSGHGTDGTRGLQAVSRNGGMHFIQSPESSIQSEMPNTALTLLNTTSTYTPEEISSKLIEYTQNPKKYSKKIFDDENKHPLKAQDSNDNIDSGIGDLQREVKPKKGDNNPDVGITSGLQKEPLGGVNKKGSLKPMPDAIGDEELETSINSDEYTNMVDRIVYMLSEFTEVDISYYKRNTILRRLEKRINILGLTSLEDYYELLQGSPSEMNLLFREFLINVTDFFRNPLAFQYLQKHVIPKLCASKKPMQIIRVWVAACATGEEAYSLAMLLQEYINDENLKLDFKIFATDLNEEAVNFASIGRYNNLPIDSYFSTLFYKYFNKRDGVYEIQKSIRKKIIFSRHNIIKDPPFIKLDLVSCRNLFIYLKPKIQEKLIYNFHYALNKSGYLFLGSNEYLPELKQRFDEVSTPNRVFQVKEKLDHTTYSKLRANTYWFANNPSANTLSNRATVQTSAPYSSPEQDPYLEVLALQYAPPSTFVTTEGEVLYIHGEVDKYLRLPLKNRNLNIFNMTEGSLNLVIRNGLRKIKIEHTKIEYHNVAVIKHGQELSVSITLVPLTKNLPVDRVLIEFKEGNAPPTAIAEAQESSITDERTERIKNLQHELTLLREELESTVNQLEVSNQELQASNEEFMAANEEMQSTNEELQSANEELYTVNTELQEKIQELTVLYNDQDNLFASIDIGTVFLDAKLKIRKFTPAIKENFNLKDGDIGRPIEHFTNNLNDDSILEDIRQVFRKLRPVEKTLQNINGQFFLARIFPYITNDNRIDGVIITLVNITDLENAHLKEKELRHTLQHRTDQLAAREASYISLVKNIPDQIDRFDRELRYIFANKMEGDLEPKDALGKTIREVNAFNDLATVATLENGIEKTFTLGKEVKLHIEFGEGNEYTAYETILVPELMPDNSFNTVLAISRDITEKHRYEKELLHSNWTIKSLMNNIPDIIVRFDIGYNCTFISQSISNHLGIKPQNILEKNLTDFGVEDPLIDKLRKTISEVCKVKERTELDIEIPIHNELKHFRVQFIPEFTDDSRNVASVLTIASDFTRQKEKELEIQIKNQELKSINEYLDNFVYTVAHDLRAPVGNLIMVLDFLDDIKSEEERIEFMKKISRLAHRLDNTLTGLLQILETQFTHQSDKEELSFGSVLNFIKEEHVDLISNAQATIIEDFTKAPKISYIEGYLQSIIRNLLSNALKYRAKNRDTVVKFSTEEVDNCIKLSIVDNGLGFDMKQVGENLFKPFKRFTNVAEGKGIGMHIIKTMVEKNGGRIEVSSKIGKGTTFCVYLRPYSSQTENTIEEITNSRIKDKQV